MVNTRVSLNPPRFEVLNKVLGRERSCTSLQVAHQALPKSDVGDRVILSSPSEHRANAAVITRQKLESLASASMGTAMAGVCVGIPGYLAICAAQAFPHSPQLGGGLAVLAAGTGIVTGTGLLMASVMSTDSGGYAGIVGCLAGATGTALWVARGLGAI